MAINIEKEKLMTLSEASQSLPRFNKRRISVVTLWRWVTSGYHGVFLDHVCIGRKIAVTKATLNQFFLEVAKLDTNMRGPSNHKPKPKRRHRHLDITRQRDLDNAREILIRAKIIQPARQKAVRV